MKVYIYSIKVLNKISGKITPITAVSEAEGIATYLALEIKEALWGSCGTVIESKTEYIETNYPYSEGICATLPSEVVKEVLRDGPNQ